MAIYSLSQRTVVTAAAGATWEIIAGAVRRPRILEIGLSQVTAVAGTYGLGRPAAVGVDPVPVLFSAELVGDHVSTVNGAVAWSTTAPTVPTLYLRRVTCPATIGAGVIWTFPRGLYIAATLSIVIWVIATAPVCDVWCVLDE